METPLWHISYFPLNTVILNGFCMLGLCMFGLFGNCLCLTVLIRTYLGTTTFRNYLSALCVADSLTLVSCLFMLVIPILANFASLQQDVQSLANQLILIFYPIGTIAENVSTLLIAAISLVRCLAVIYPLQMRAVNTTHFAHTVICGVFLFACLFNVPRLFELTLTTCLYRNNSTMLMLDITTLRNSYSYKVYYMIMANGLVMFLIPFAVIVGCNCAVIYKYFTYKSSWLEVEQIGSSHRHSALNRSHSDMTTQLLIFLSLLFLFCHVMPLIVSTIEASSYLLGWQLVQQALYSQMVDISNFLVAVKASSNFLFYMMFNRRFRQLILRRHSS